MLTLDKIEDQLKLEAASPGKMIPKTTALLIAKNILMIGKEE